MCASATSMGDVIRGVTGFEKSIDGSDFQKCRLIFREGKREGKDKSKRLMYNLLKLQG